MNNRLIIDLETLSQAADVRAKAPRLTEILRKASNTLSCLADIQQGIEFLEELKNNSSVNSDFKCDGHNTVASSLLISSLVFYARATSTSGSKGERGSIDIRSELDSSQRIDHNHIISVRNRALAHVYSDKYDIRWHFQRIFLILQGGVGQLSSVTNAMTFSTESAIALDRQLPVAFEIIRKKHQNYNDKILGILASAGISFESYASHEVDPKDHLASERMAFHAYNPPPPNTYRRIFD